MTLCSNCATPLEEPHYSLSYFLGAGDYDSGTMRSFQLCRDCGDRQIDILEKTQASITSLIKNLFKEKQDGVIAGSFDSGR